MAIPILFNRIPPDKRLDREAAITLALQSLFTFGSSLSSIFLNLYLWRLTESLWINGIYNIVSNAFIAVCFVIGGKLAKKLDRMVVYRIGITLIALFYLCILLAKVHVAEYYILFAVFSGIGSGFYWIGYWTLLYDVSNDGNRMRFLGLSSAFSTAAAMSGPLLSGVIFNAVGGLRGYTIVFGIAFVVFLLTAVLSLLVPKAPSHRKAYYLGHMGLLLRKNKTWRKAMYGNLITGIMQGVFLFLPQILLIAVFQKESFVSYFGAFLSMLTILINILFSKLARERHERKYLLWSVIGYMIAASLLLFKLSPVIVISFMILQTLFGPLKSNAFDSYFYRLIGTLPLKGKLRIESMVVREISWDAGRIATVFLLISLSSNLNAPWLPWVVIGSCASQFLLFFLMDELEQSTKRR
ncbi:MFS transporter [Paenibacillus sp. V4I7]|uniref:MFS transporter n=1 Tax=Paenibacillus sp. V4I7 TaxID=3042307 RepID=UPI00278118A2|nr:MFS transporter [Paenibacillus sp. V4I7]MDQ0898989.1 YQGE family putative transporter [Paenibacillus sp. V4I7]